MKIPRASRTTGVGFNMTPMIDVVFQLLIFFLLSNDLPQRDRNMELQLPKAASGEEQRDKQEPYLVINVQPDHQLVLVGRGTIELPQLREHLATVAREQGRDIEVRIRSDREVPYGVVEPILRSCAATGIWNVSFAVNPK